MTPPIGVLTDSASGSFLRLVTSYGEVSPWVMQQSSPPAGPTCLDAGCKTAGCWAAPFGPSETFHCQHCIEPFAIDYQCHVYSRMCLNCCGHTTCGWDYAANQTHGGSGFE